MATLISRHAVVLRPDHLLLQVRDVDCDAGVGGYEAIAETHKNIVASSGYAIYAEAAQNLIAVRLWVEVWDAEPEGDPLDEAWHGPTLLELDCPSGDLLAGDDMGNAIGDIQPPQGAGRYRVAFFHHGREEAISAQQQMYAAMARGADSEEIGRLCAGRAGTERYLFRLWWLVLQPVVVAYGGSSRLR